MLGGDDGDHPGYVCQTHWKAVESDSLPAELLELDHPGIYLDNLLVNMWRTPVYI